MEWLKVKALSSSPSTTKKNEFKASLGKVSENPISKMKTKQKKAGGMVQVVEPLPSMHEDLYSVPLLQKSAY
jgi:hypothetical protein